MVKNGHAAGEIASIKSCLRVYLEQNVCARLEMERCNESMNEDSNRENPQRRSLKVKSAMVLAALIFWEEKSCISPGYCCQSRV